MSGKGQGISMVCPLVEDYADNGREPCTNSYEV